MYIIIISLPSGPLPTTPPHPTSSWYSTSALLFRPSPSLSLFLSLSFSTVLTSFPSGWLRSHILCLWWQRWPPHHVSFPEPVIPEGKNEKVLSTPPSISFLRKAQTGSVLEPLLCPDESYSDWTACVGRQSKTNVARLMSMAEDEGSSKRQNIAGLPTTTTNFKTAEHSDMI